MIIEYHLGVVETRLATVIWVLQEEGGIFSSPDGDKWLPRIDHDTIYTPTPVPRPLK